ncbi:uncharacterized protein LOC108940773 [Scleropages formosus]|uniref:Nucleoporin NUP42 n=1 Tax=Scleropages formosus TaxID=113540 RepID=A0A8C9V771_SCLFO|nr:uncharacterized protein LOC108940773 [Scleropages formosus]
MDNGENPSPVSQTKEEKERPMGPPESGTLDRRLCRFYSQGRYCQFGKKCRFLHQRADPKHTPKGMESMAERGLGKPEGNATHHDGSANSGETGLPSNPRVLVGRKGQIRHPCRYFLSGYCAMEERCHFWHPSDLPPIPNLSPKERSDLRPRAPVDHPSNVQNVKLSELTADVAKHLRDTEINQLIKRIPKDQLFVQEREDGQLTFYRVVVQPTDPEWPFDLKEIHIMVSFPERYPQEVFTLVIPEDQDLPSIMAKHVAHASQEWLQARHATNELMGKVELLFRPFLRWLDRNLERLFTDGARQLKRDIDAERSGIQFVSYQQLQAAVCKDPCPATAVDFSGTGCSDREEEEEEDDESEEEGDNDMVGVKEEVLPSEGEKGSLQVENIRSAEPRKGTEVKLLGLRLGEETATVTAKQLTLSLQCNRCKVTADLQVSEGLPCSAQCEKCSTGISVTFRPSVLHRFCDILGYLDVNNAVPSDLVLQECELVVGCLSCSQEGPLQKLSYGQNKELNCQHCHSKLGIFVESTRFQLIQPRLRNNTGQGEQKYTYGRYLRDPAIQKGKPLPGKGTCKHFRQSHRWLRFPCCGRAYPCDLCHDEDQDHPMEMASRMLCGYCAKEQPYSNGKPCICCGSMMTRSAQTNHWEGGQGCRNKVKMSRNDHHKYSSTNKTVSRKAKSEKK